MEKSTEVAHKGVLPTVSVIGRRVVLKISDAVKFVQLNSVVLFLPIAPNELTFSLSLVVHTTVFPKTHPLFRARVRR